MPGMGAALHHSAFTAGRKGRGRKGGVSLGQCLSAELRHNFKLDRLLINSPTAQLQSGVATVPAMARDWLSDWP